MSDIFQEVQEEYRREQMAKLWQKYRVPIVVGATVLILAVAGYQGWSYWRAAKLEDSSREFERVADIAASGPGQEQTAADAFAKLAADASGGYPMAAKFQEAGLRTELGRIPDALKLYDQIAASVRDPLFRDYAQLRAAILVLETESLDNIKRRLEPITTGSGPWRVVALEMLAYASWRAGKKEEALRLYAEVRSISNAPTGSARRATEMTSLINAGMKLSDLRTKPGQSTPGLAPMLLQPTAPPTPAQPILPAPVEEGTGLLGPAVPEQPATP